MPFLPRLVPQYFVPYMCSVGLAKSQIERTLK